MLTLSWSRPCLLASLQYISVNVSLECGSDDYTAFSQTLSTHPTIGKSAWPPGCGTLWQNQMLELGMLISKHLVLLHLAPRSIATRVPDHDS